MDHRGLAPTGQLKSRAFAYDATFNVFLERTAGLAPQKGVRNCSWQRTALRPRPLSPSPSSGEGATTGESRPSGSRIDPPDESCGMSPVGFLGPSQRPLPEMHRREGLSDGLPPGRGPTGSAAAPSPGAGGGREAGIVAGAQLQRVEAAGDGDEAGAARGASVLGRPPAERAGSALRRVRAGRQEAQDHEVEEGADDREPQEDVQEAEGHVGRLSLQRLVVLQRHKVAEADGGERDEAVVVGVEEGPALEVREGGGPEGQGARAHQQPGHRHVLGGHARPPQAQAALGRQQEAPHQRVQPLAEALEGDQGQGDAQERVEHAEDLARVRARRGVAVPWRRKEGGG